MTIKELLNQAVIMLKNENIDAPKTKARMLLQATLKKTREYIMIYDNQEVQNIERDRYIKNSKVRGLIPNKVISLLYILRRANTHWCV